MVARGGDPAAPPASARARRPRSLRERAIALLARRDYARAELRERPELAQEIEARIRDAVGVAMPGRIKPEVAGDE